MTDYAARRTMMVDAQVRPSDVTKFPIIEAMLAVPREMFVPQDRKEAAYLGENVSIGANRVLLEPRTLAKMLDAVDIQPDELVLDLGAGQGYAAAVMSRIAEAVIAVEEDADIAADSQQLLSDLGADNVVLHEAKLTEGAPEHGPYDVIVLEGAVEHLPEAITDQLKEGGRIVVLFAEGHLGVVRVGYKIDGKVSWRFSFNAGAPVLPGFERHAVFTL
ncbi:protein-L-isoaspartate O-methyltransferase [Pseudooceanicola sediminis]|uniref:Protein-L-isoaspartate O-methyltransferase n=1 Tax=Pseudooceanicola sediminis TaxID=2211117 RepID=A0A399J3Y2_9RHOB|nr:protein-L-isoaspartate O-methyltransferase [Pseudooceanicola sediminis]KAA2311457.1 protein-L-isoaspartate O-methyltransferase [Puniceibacterium sp. HSS470]RII40064.1 protein-L-isoaspartate O-methyltransferase [Pseudooceanicola sediminis]|tara:strand:+ start:4073 stop:4726 length:654 start_codon:yes stop_codon:yes gene_type:complete